VAGQDSGRANGRPPRRRPEIDLTQARGYLCANLAPCDGHVPQIPSEVVSELLVKWRAGDQQALQALIPFVYRELHTLAHHYLRQERSGHTLQTTALVHEAYLRMVDQRPFAVENRAHFIGVAARLMRLILVDHARSHRAAKRGPDGNVELDVALPLPHVPNADVVALDDALKTLEQVDQQQSRLVELRLFGGLTTEEAAEVPGISRSTAKRDWNVAKARLSRQMKRGRRAQTGAVGKN
jgi:RNA polymerase sigma factor (TIGR02999 family)